MNRHELAQLSDQELLDVAKANKPYPMVDAFFIGFFVGIIVFGVAANTWGFFALIPLCLIYLLLKKPKQYEAV